MWTIDDAPDQSSRTVVVTGANAGLGRETARVLASRGATVILACRDVAKGEAAADSIAAASAAERDRLRVIRLDLGSLASVSAAADEIVASCPRLDLLINNAGVMAIPFARSEDGFELTFATNHLGHFALTGLLLEQLLATPGSRVVTLSSVAHRRGHCDFDALESEQGYDPGRAYERSKLANLLFAYELQHRSARGRHRDDVSRSPPGHRPHRSLADKLATGAGAALATPAPTHLLARPECRGRRAPRAPRCRRPRGPRRRLLRSRRLVPVHRPTGTRRLQPELARRLGPTRALADVRAVERDLVSPDGR